MIRLTSYDDARDAFRQKDLRQALYDEGHRLMTGVIVNLHGPEHLARRRLENRLFRRDTFAWYEREVIPAVIGDLLAPAVAAGTVDLLPLARRTMLTLALRIAGIDLLERTHAELDRIDALMIALARASTVAHATGDKATIVAAGDAALAEFAATWLEPSMATRAAALHAHAAGTIGDDGLPRDVLTTLLRDQDRLELPLATLVREVAYFPWVGSHSTSNEFVHAMHHVFEWLHVHPSDRRRLLEDRLLLQRFVHESLRLHPASPVSMRRALAPVVLRSGVAIAEGELLAVDLERANRDPAVFGPHADAFDPFRPLPDGVPPWGLSFGHGVHACLGQELAGGLEPEPGQDVATHLHGAIAVMARTLLANGARPEPTRPPQRDEGTTRVVWAHYPVVFVVFGDGPTAAPLSAPAT